MLFSFYSLDIAVIQYWTFSRVRLLTPTVILILPIPVNSYSIIIIRSNGFWFAFPGFGFLTYTFLAPVKIESNCNTARVDNMITFDCYVLSIKRAVFVDRNAKMTLLSTKRAIFVDEGPGYLLYLHDVSIVFEITQQKIQTNNIQNGWI